MLGYTCVNDVTARDLQKKDGQWSRAKGFDTFCPVGPWIETDLDPSDLSVKCIVDGEVRQDGRTSQMMFDVATLIAYVSRAFTLEPGDLIAHGHARGRRSARARAIASPSPSRSSVSSRSASLLPPDRAEASRA